MKFADSFVVQPSVTLVINSKALEKKARGERVFNLSAGEPMLPPAAELVQATSEALRLGMTRYAPAAGLSILRTEATKWFNETFQANYNIDQCLVTCGGKHALFMLSQALFNPGDEAIIISPYWVSYVEMVKLFGGVPQIVATTFENGWKVTTSDLQKKVSAKTKVLFLNNACNPTGVIYSRAELKDILDWAQQNNILVISDEVYSGLTYEGEFISAAAFPEFKDNVVIIQSCSKHFAMTGWRVGIVFASVEIIQALSALQSQSTSGTATISQFVATAAFKNSARINTWVKAELRARRDVMVKTLRELWQKEISAPAAGLYMFVPLDFFGAESDSVKFCTRVLEQANIAMVPGAAFGKDGYVRLSFGDTADELKSGLESLSKFLKNN